MLQLLWLRPKQWQEVLLQLLLLLLIPSCRWAV